MVSATLHSTGRRPVLAGALGWDLVAGPCSPGRLGRDPNPDFHEQFPPRACPSRTAVKSRHPQPGTLCTYDRFYLMPFLNGNVTWKQVGAQQGDVGALALYK